jgi:hypothetical protein
MSQSDPNQEDPRSLWQAQPQKENLVMSTEDLIKKESKLARTVRFRNVREYVAGVIVIGAFVVYAVAIPGASPSAWMMRLACALIALGTALVLARLRRDGSPLEAPSASAPTADHVAHHRASLTRQRDLLRGVPKWYIGPLVPGVVVFFVAAWLHAPETVPLARRAFVAGEAVVICFAMFGVIIAANRFAARKLEADIEALD